MPYIIAIDQSTSASKVFLVNEKGKIIKRFVKEHRQFYPQSGYAEHDASEIWKNVQQGIAEITYGLKAEELVALSISNQRETTVLWDKTTGEPVCRAVVWQDVRGDAFCKTISAHAQAVKEKTGLLLSAYYPAAKAAAVLQENPAFVQKAQEGSLAIGTIDSYLVYRLTNGETFATDVSNASRTQLINLKALAWDEDLLSWFGIDKQCLATIQLSDADFGKIACEGLPQGVPITGVIGDSHAALFGQGCLEAGMAKATFGTGSSVMMNVGTEMDTQTDGLSCSVGFGFEGKVCYVLEGNVTCSGDTLVWLKEQAGIVDDVKEVESIASSVPSTDGVYFIPAFSGLGAPYFSGEARAALVGINRGTTSAHIVRAALESMAYQDADIIAEMVSAVKQPLNVLRVDGGPSQNTLLMQLLSDLIGCPVWCAKQNELSALGAAYMAGIAKSMYQSFAEIEAVHDVGACYESAYTSEQSKQSLVQWRNAVKRCL